MVEWSDRHPGYSSERRRDLEGRELHESRFLQFSSAWVKLEKLSTILKKNEIRRESTIVDESRRERTRVTESAREFQAKPEREFELLCQLWFYLARSGMA